ncbi:hypothetical protein [Intestinibacter sp.]|uniref:hypothetical protein n=1 Tax=Intestinibacter sp. TaxID=1965304 RepID=UPI003F147779
MARLNFRGLLKIALGYADTLNTALPSSSDHPSDDSKSEITVAGSVSLAYSSVTNTLFI